jgi:PAS domain S-box-containing protein
MSVDDLRTQKELLQKIVDHIPVMIVFLDTDRQIQLVNRETERTLGWSLAELRSEDMDVFAACYPDAKERERALSCVKTSNGEWNDFRTTVKDGRVIDTSWAVIRLSDGTRLGIGTDVSARKRAEAAEREQRLFAEALRGTAGALNSTLDYEEVLQRILETVGRVVPHDGASITLLERDQWRLAGSRGFGEGALDEVVDRSQVRALQSNGRRQSLGADEPWSSFDAREGPASARARAPWVRSEISAPIKIKGRTIGVLSLVSATADFFTDSHTERLQAFLDPAAMALQNARLVQEVQSGRERLQTLSNQLLVAQEAERVAVARELHDEIGQVLTAVGANLRTIELSPDPPTLVDRLHESLHLVDEALKKVRDLSLDLRPSLLDDFGLVPALEWFVKGQAQRSGFEATFIADSHEVRLAPNLETTCFRVAQIALANVTRHARAKHVCVELRHNGAELELMIRDDGIGFDVQAAIERAARGATLGLSSMQERVRLASGELEIDSTPGRGTEIRTRFPMRGAESEHPGTPILTIGAG